MTKANSTGRHGARRLILQALYQHQMAGHDCADLLAQFRRRSAFAQADQGYFEAVVQDVLARKPALDAMLDPFLDRPVSQLDPIEHALLWLGVAELSAQQEVPALVCIDEAVELAKEFGGQDSYRLVNAVLDKAAQQLRARTQ